MRIPEYFPASELVGLPGMPTTTRGINLMGDRGELERQQRQIGKGWEYHISSLPIEAKAALLRRFAPQPEPPKQRKRQKVDTQGLWENFERQPEHRKEKARERLQILLSIQALVDAGEPSRQSHEKVAAEYGLTASAVYRFKKQTEGLPQADWLPALLPATSPGPELAKCSPEAWDFFKADYLRLEKPAAEACYRRLQRAAEQAGWTIPSCKTLQRRIDREIPRSVQVLARDGVEAMNRIFPAQERDRSGLRALEALNADGHKFDVFCRWPDGTVARPIMVSFQDIYSGKFLAYRVDRTEHSGIIRLAFGDVVEQYGIPERVVLDNGRSFAAKFLTGGVETRYRFKVKDSDPLGLFPAMGVNIHWATPYHGQAKPIERGFRDLCEDVAKHPAFAGAYTGNTVEAKPENYGSRAVPFEEFMEVLKSEIAAHNAREGRRGGVTEGRSFDAVFAESYARSAIRKATAAQRRLWLLAAEKVFANRTDGSVTVMGNRYWNEALAQHAGRWTVVRFDPDNLHKPAAVYAHDGRFLCEAEKVNAVGFFDVEAAREHAKAKGDFRRATRKKLEAAKRLEVAEAAAMVPAAEPAEAPQTNVITLATQRMKKVVNGPDLPDDEDTDFTRMGLGMLAEMKARKY